MWDPLKRDHRPLHLQWPLNLHWLMSFAIRSCNVCALGSEKRCKWPPCESRRIQLRCIPHSADRMTAYFQPDRQQTHSIHQRVFASKLMSTNRISMTLDWEEYSFSAHRFCNSSATPLHPSTSLINASKKSSYTLDWKPTSERNDAWPWRRYQHVFELGCPTWQSKRMQTLCKNSSHHGDIVGILWTLIVLPTES